MASPTPSLGTSPVCARPTASRRRKRAPARNLADSERDHPEGYCKSLVGRVDGEMGWTTARLSDEGGSFPLLLLCQSSVAPPCPAKGEPIGAVEGYAIDALVQVNDGRMAAQLSLSGGRITRAAASRRRLRPCRSDLDRRPPPTLLVPLLFSVRPGSLSLAPIAGTRGVRGQPFRRGERGRTSAAGARGGTGTRSRGGGRSRWRGWRCM